MIEEERAAHTAMGAVGAVFWALHAYHGMSDPELLRLWLTVTELIRRMADERDSLNADDLAGWLRSKLRDWGAEGGETDDDSTMHDLRPGDG